MTRIPMTRLAAMLAAATLVSGCAGRDSRPEPAEVEVEVWGDTSSAITLKVEPPLADRARVRTVAIARPAALGAPLPDAAPQSLPLDSLAAQALEVDPGLRSPILREPARMRLPASGARSAGPVTIELDVHVSAEGGVTDARWAGGSADTAWVAAAIACAHTMRFHPALLGGVPVAVWARQRFELP